MSSFYEQHPYPPPVDDLETYRSAWDEHRRRADSHLFHPDEPYRDDRTVLVAGCGTVQAAHYAVRWPRAKVVGIDFSAPSIEFTRKLKEKHALDNLEVHQLPVERAPELGHRFEHVVCTGVLHHLPDPDAGLRALAEVLEPGGALHLMVYAPYGRTGVYLLQEYCRRLGIGYTEEEVQALIASLKALPPDHPLVPLLRNSPDFSDRAAVADALLHPQDRAFTVPELIEVLDRADLSFGRWVRQAPYLPDCGAIAMSPHHPKLRALSPAEQFAAMELFRGTMVRHSFVAYGRGHAAATAIDFGGDNWPEYRPIRLPDTLEVREQLPEGAAAVLINRTHSYPDLYLPIDAREHRLLSAVDGERTIAEMCTQPGDAEAARSLFRRLWQWDQVVFDTMRRQSHWDVSDAQNRDTTR